MRIINIALLLGFQSFTACAQLLEDAPTTAVQLASTSISTHPQDSAYTPPDYTNILFQSADGGQTWQNISAGLPENLGTDGFYAGDAGLYLCAENGMYRSKSADKVPVWEKELFLNGRIANVYPSRNGLFAYTHEGLFFQKINGTNVWIPRFTDFRGQSVRTVFETLDGTVFIGCDNGLFKSTDQGKTWKHVFEAGWVIEMAESDGVIICTNQHGIMRSTDDGESWDWVIQEGGVGIAVETIGGGFAAITYNTDSETRRVRISTDGGITWQPIDMDIPPHALIASIKQVGQYFFCGHPDGILRSSDKGKTWELILPAIGGKVFNLSVSGNVIYAVPRNGGC